MVAPPIARVTGASGTCHPRKLLRHCGEFGATRCVEEKRKAARRSALRRSGSRSAIRRQQSSPSFGILPRDERDAIFAVCEAL